MTAAVGVSERCQRYRNSLRAAVGNQISPHLATLNALPRRLRSCTMLPRLIIIGRINSKHAMICSVWFFLIDFSEREIVRALITIQNAPCCNLCLPAAGEKSHLPLQSHPTNPALGKLVPYLKFSYVVWFRDSRKVWNPDRPPTKTSARRQYTSSSSAKGVSFAVSLTREEVERSFLSRKSS